MTTNGNAVLATITIAFRKTTRSFTIVNKPCKYHTFRIQKHGTDFDKYHSSLSVACEELTRLVKVGGGQEYVLTQLSEQDEVIGSVHEYSDRMNDRNSLGTLRCPTWVPLERLWCWFMDERNRIAVIVEF